MLKRTILLAAVAGMVLALPPAAAQAELAGQLGILDLTANEGINPGTEAAWAFGDPYRLFFLTSASTTAESSNIATYDAFVQGLADVSTAYNMSPVTWRVFGSTDAVEFVDHNQINWTESSLGDPVYQLDGTTLVAKDFRAMCYDRCIVHPLLTDTGESVNEGKVWTGSTRIDFPGIDTYKYDFPGVALGAVTEEGWSTWGNQGAEMSARAWFAYWRDPQTAEFPLYAMSEELTIVPEPATLALLGLGGLGLVLGRKRR